MLEITNIFLLPRISERVPAGRLISIPGIVDADATKPINGSGVSRLFAKGFNTGFLDIVELKIAKLPIKQKIQNHFSFESYGFLCIYWSSTRLTSRIYDL